MADLSSCLKFSLFLSLNEWVNLRKYCSSFCLRLTPEAWGIRAGWLCWVWYFEWLFPLILEADARFLTILVDSWLRKKLTHRQSEWKAHRALRLLPRSSCLIIMPGVRVTIITSPGPWEVLPTIHPGILTEYDLTSTSETKQWRILSSFPETLLVVEPSSILMIIASGWWKLVTKYFCMQ